MTMTHYNYVCGVLFICTCLYMYLIENSKEKISQCFLGGGGGDFETGNISLQFGKQYICEAPYSFQENRTLLYQYTCILVRG